jgi:hypothetical protein
MEVKTFRLKFTEDFATFDAERKLVKTLGDVRAFKRYGQSGANPMSGQRSLGRRSATVTVLKRLPEKPGHPR